ncbi:MAG: hypothetical protein GTN93_14225 [Anaerolineae bacterium]|nr:hypothetical protein [Anaerolineae bacterium]
MTLLWAEDLNDDDVDEWYDRHGEQYSQAVEAIVEGIDDGSLRAAIDFLGQVYQADHVLRARRRDLGREVVGDRAYSRDAVETLWRLRDSRG